MRVVEARCPFCDARLDRADGPAANPAATVRAHGAGSAKPRLGRAALFAFGAAAAATTSIAACSSGTVPTYGDGGALTEGGTDGTAAGDTSTVPDTSLPDTGAVAKPYGAPPADGFVEIV